MILLPKFQHQGYNLVAKSNTIDIQMFFIAQHSKHYFLNPLRDISQLTNDRLTITNDLLTILIIIEMSFLRKEKPKESKESKIATIGVSRSSSSLLSQSEGPQCLRCFMESKLKSQSHIDFLSSTMDPSPRLKKQISFSYLPRGQKRGHFDSGASAHLKLYSRQSLFLKKLPFYPRKSSLGQVAWIKPKISFTYSNRDCSELVHRIQAQLIELNEQPEMVKQIKAAQIDPLSVDLNSSEDNQKWKLSYSYKTNSTFIPLRSTNGNQSRRNDLEDPITRTQESIAKLVEEDQHSQNYILEEVDEDMQLDDQLKCDFDHLFSDSEGTTERHQHQMQLEEVIQDFEGIMND